MCGILCVSAHMKVYAFIYDSCASLSGDGRYVCLHSETGNAQ